MKQPLLSIIIPAYNAEKIIQPIVNRILTEKFKDFELILVNDGSTDNTLSVLKQIAERDDRVCVYDKPNGGPSSARNLGIKKATGTYIQFFDSDDNIPPNALLTTTQAMAKTKSDLLVSGWQIDLQTARGLIKECEQIHPEEQSVSSNITQYTLRSLGTNGLLYNLWNKLFRADIIRNNAIQFREDIRFGEDLLFALEYFTHTKKLSVIPDITYQYQTNSKTSVFSSSSLVPEYRIVNDEAVVAFAGAHPGKIEQSLLHWLRWRWLMSYWSLVAGSNKKLSNKLQPINAFNPPGLVLARAQHIGSKNYLIQLIAMVARTTALGSLLLGWSINLIKKTIIFIKTTIQR